MIPNVKIMVVLITSMTLGLVLPDGTYNQLGSAPIVHKERKEKCHYWSPERELEYYHVQSETEKTRTAIYRELILSYRTKQYKNGLYKFCQYLKKGDKAVIFQKLNRNSSMFLSFMMIKKSENNWRMYVNGTFNGYKYTPMYIDAAGRKYLNKFLNKRGGPDINSSFYYIAHGGASFITIVDHGNIVRRAVYAPSYLEIGKNARKWPDGFEKLSRESNDMFDFVQRYSKRTRANQ